jgi:hypothetical protein
MEVRKNCIKIYMMPKLLDQSVFVFVCRAAAKLTFGKPKNDLLTSQPQSLGNADHHLGRPALSL